MFTIELTLRGNPIPLGVNRQELTGAEAVYQEVVAAMRGDKGLLLELTCEKQEDKKLTVVASEVLAVQISNKMGSATGMGAGFVRN